MLLVLRKIHRAPVYVQNTFVILKAFLQVIVCPPSAKQIFNAAIPVSFFHTILYTTLCLIQGFPDHKEADY